jgi:predicted AAA+ superfamily ATPase
LKRDLLNELFQWLNDSARKPLILRGARQVGKSTAVRMLAQEAGYDLIEINLERHLALNEIFGTFDIKKILTAVTSITRKSMNSEKVILFLDEIQATPYAIAALRYFYEDLPMLPVIAAGSLLEQVLAEEAIEIPVGRIQYLYVGPLTFEEFLGAREEGFFLERIRSYRWGNEWPESLHLHGLELIKEYFLVGGMPGAARHSREGIGQMSRSVQLELQSIVDTFKDDFAKYTSREALIPVLQQVYDRAPRYLSKQIIYKEIAPDSRYDYIKSAVSLLSAARVMTLAKKNDASGIPIGAGQREKSPKLFWLDIGLVNRMANLESSWLNDDVKLIYQGAIAEQFVAQHLFYWSGCYVPPSLNYWARDEKSSAAEVDFLVQWNNAIIPVEVKSGPTGSLRSLHQYLARKKPPFGVRLDSSPPVIQSLENMIAIDGKRDIRFNARLASLPLYMIGQLRRLCESV